jgi:hypothetical protein
MDERIAGGYPRIEIELCVLTIVQDNSQSDRRAVAG